MNKGKLIVIEGLDGSGKGTQTALLTAALTEKGINVKQVSFPDYNNPSSSLVKMYLNGELGSKPDDVNAYAASSFYAVDRYASYKQFWQADYEAGTVILADRYATSNAIYQLSKLAENERTDYLNWLEFYEYTQLQLPKPDAVIYLDVPIEISQKLLDKRYSGDTTKKDLHESNLEFLKQCRKSALYSAQVQGWQIVSCAEDGDLRSIEDIHNEVVQLVLNALG
ncbi:MAG: deoxynucleoside kinase [Acutalibacteraceae bacterium]|nr:deoxynucleoside kinase [Acutalibacteraceae bacterium]